MILAPAGPPTPPPIHILPAPARINHGAALISVGRQGLLACWYSGRSEAGPDVVIVCSRSADLGVTWSAPARASRPHERDLGGGAPAKSAGNVALARAAQGRLVMIAGEIQSRRIAGIETCRTWRCGRINFRISLDEGAGWSAPTRLDDRPGALPRSRPQSAPGLGDLIPVYQESRGSSVLRLDLSTLVPGEQPKFAAMPLPGSSHLLQPSLAISVRSAAVGPRVLAYLRDRRRRFVYVASLDNGRRRWSPPAPTNLPNPGSATEAFVAPGGAIALIYNPSRTDRRTLALAFSQDGVRFDRGCTLVAQGAAGDVAYPAVAPLDGARGNSGWGVAFSLEGKRRIGFMRLDNGFLGDCAASPLPAVTP
jgi:hypothetical protein